MGLFFGYFHCYLHTPFNIEVTLEQEGCKGEANKMDPTPTRVECGNQR